MGQLDTCDRLAGQVWWIDDCYLRAIGQRVVPYGQYVAVVLSAHGLARREDRFAGRHVRAEVERIAASGGVVALDQNLEAELARGAVTLAGEVGEAMFEARQPIVDAREIARLSGVLLGLHGAITQLEREAMRQRRMSAKRIAAHIECGHAAPVNYDQIVRLK